MVSLIIDIVIALICFVIIVRNAARGFIRSFMAFAKTVLAIFLAYVFNAPLAGLLDEKIFLSLSTGWVNSAFISTYDGEGAYQLYTLFDGIPEWFTSALMRSGVDEATIQQYFYGNESAPLEVVEHLSSSLGALLSSVISTILAVILIFVVVEIVLAIIGALLNKAGQLPIVRFVNIILGALIGAVFAAAIALLLATVIISIINFGAGYNQNVFSSDLISNSIILNFFNTHNMWRWIASLVIGG
ncbi:MAG: CvpA family protein [Clostridia bacterium]|nr:CvpA family protein [Clostridia bacterium]